MVIMLRSELWVHVASSLGLQPCMVNDGIVRTQRTMLPTLVHSVFAGMAS